MNDRKTVATGHASASNYVFYHHDHVLPKRNIFKVVYDRIWCLCFYMCDCSATRVQIVHTLQYIIHMFMIFILLSFICQLKSCLINWKNMIKIRAARLAMLTSSHIVCVTEKLWCADHDILMCSFSFSLIYIIIFPISILIHASYEIELAIILWVSCLWSKHFKSWKILSRAIISYHYPLCSWGWGPGGTTHLLTSPIPPPPYIPPCYSRLYCYLHGKSIQCQSHLLFILFTLSFGTSQHHYFSWSISKFLFFIVKNYHRPT